MPGAYFITVVTYQRYPIFRSVEEGRFHSNRYGKIVENAWYELPHHYPQVSLGAFVIMPNHIHGIVIIQEGDNIYGRGGSQTRPNDFEGNIQKAKMLRYGMSEIVRAFKSFSALQINNLRKKRGLTVWQHSYYDRIIRSEHELQDIGAYIQSNPLNWQDDELLKSTNSE